MLSNNWSDDEDEEIRKLLRDKELKKYPSDSSSSDVFVAYPTVFRPLCITQRPVGKCCVTHIEKEKREEQIYFKRHSEEGLLGQYT